MEKKISVLNLTEELAQKSNISSTVAESFIRSFFDIISENLAQDGTVKIKGWGTFKLSAVRDRESVDVTTGERIVIKGYRKVSFLPETALKEHINKPFAQFETTELSEDFQLDDEAVVVEEQFISSDNAEEKAEVIPEEVSVETAEEKTEEPINEVEEQVEEAVDEAKELIVESTEEVKKQESEPEDAVQEQVQEQIVEPVKLVDNPIAQESPVASEISERTEEPKQAEQSEQSVKTETSEKVSVEADTPKTSEKKPRKSWKYWLPIFLLVLISVCLYIYITFGSGFSKPKLSLKPSEKEKIKVEAIDFEDTPRSSVVVTLPEEKKTQPQEKQEEQEESVPQEEVTIEEVEDAEEEPLPETEVKVKPQPESKEQPQPQTVKKEETKPKAEVKTEAEVKKEDIKDATNKSLKDITLADTTAFTILGTRTTHTLQEGETIIRLAQKYYGDKRLWPYIVKHNDMKNPNSVVVGKTINIPDLKAK